MKKIISLLFVVLLMVSCGKADDTINPEGSGNIEGSGVQEINNISDENIDWNTNVFPEENTSEENTSEEISTWDINTSEEISTWGINTDSKFIEDNSAVINSKDEDKLIENAINEIDNIINEVDVNVK